MVPATSLPTTTSVRAKVAALADRYNNMETGIFAAAVKADAEGRPAYWRTTQYHNAAAGLLCGNANLIGLDAALADVVDERHPGKTVTALLGTLIPLNTAAETELSAARARAYWSDAPGARDMGRAA